jgi:hypothetical protein
MRCFALCTPIISPVNPARLMSTLWAAQALRRVSLLLPGLISLSVAPDAPGAPEVNRWWIITARTCGWKELLTLNWC